MSPRAGWNGFAGRIWPAGRSLENPAVEERHFYLYFLDSESRKPISFEKAYLGFGVTLLLKQLYEKLVLLERHIT